MTNMWNVISSGQSGTAVGTACNSFLVIPSPTIGYCNVSRQWGIAFTDSFCVTCFGVSSDATKLHYYLKLFNRSDTINIGW